MSGRRPASRAATALSTYIFLVSRAPVEWMKVNGSAMSRSSAGRSPLFSAPTRSRSKALNSCSAAEGAGEAAMPHSSASTASAVVISDLHHPHVSGHDQRGARRLLDRLYRRVRRALAQHQAFARHFDDRHVGHDEVHAL